MRRDRGTGLLCSDAPGWPRDAEAPRLRHVIAGEDDQATFCQRLHGAGRCNQRPVVARKGLDRKGLEAGLVCAKGENGVVRLGNVQESPSLFHGRLLDEPAVDVNDLQAALDAAIQGSRASGKNCRDKDARCFRTGQMAARGANEVQPEAVLIFDQMDLYIRPTPVPHPRGKNKSRCQRGVASGQGCGHSGGPYNDGVGVASCGRVFKSAGRSLGPRTGQKQDAARARVRSARHKREGDGMEHTAEEIRGRHRQAWLLRPERRGKPAR